MTQKNETMPRNIRQCLESAGICHGEGDTCCDLHIGNISSITYHVGSQYSDPNLQHKRPFSAQSMPLMASEETHDLNSVSDVSHRQRVRGSTGGRTHNVRQRLRAANLLNTFASPPIPPVQGPTVLPNPGMTPLNHLSQGPRHEKLQALLNSYLEEQRKRRDIEACCGTQAKRDELEKELSNLVGLNELKLQLRKWAKGMLLDERQRALGLKVGTRKMDEGSKR